MEQYYYYIENDQDTCYEHSRKKAIIVSSISDIKEVTKEYLRKEKITPVTEIVDTIDNGFAAVIGYYHYKTMNQQKVDICLTRCPLIQL
ncbi:hypothetical protein KGQ34_01960 [Patescibacteria group bacterium]|nr:hypothetical protein [Patescibacteria group bacterium]